jgi:hypothetical protein
MPPLKSHAVSPSATRGAQAHPSPAGAGVDMILPITQAVESFNDD